MKITKPHFEYENRLIEKGFRFVVGVDEVGRGPWAGPVVAGAVILNCEIVGLNDSKKLCAKKRELLANEIYKVALDCGIGETTVDEIDKIGIQKATFLAFSRAIERLRRADFLLIDGLQWIGSPLPSNSIIKGDAICCSIAAASIIAKVYRDNLMVGIHDELPEYRFDLHKGYGTKLHMENLQKFGVSQHHRKSFAPIKKLVQKSPK